MPPKIKAKIIGGWIDDGKRSIGRTDGAKPFTFADNQSGEDDADAKPRSTKSCTNDLKAAFAALPEITKPMINPSAMPPDVATPANEDGRLISGTAETIDRWGRTIHHVPSKKTSRKHKAAV